MLSEKAGERGGGEDGERGAAASCLAAHKWEINTSASLMLRCLMFLAGNFNDVG